jgi:hypothetical protein
MSPDQRRVIATCFGNGVGEEGAYDLWVLDKFEPPAKK